MKHNVSVWIDHRKATIVHVTDNGEETHSILSDVEKHVRYSGGIPEDQQEHRFANHLKEFYAKVALSLREADSILILGPGEAKTELKTYLEHESLGDKIAGIETADKMTDRQIAAKGREQFSPAHAN
jgi:stalled ribosome rescue protein Dom34